MNKIAYRALVVKELQLAKKSYNLLAHTFLSWRMFRPAMDYFKKLKDCEFMDKDLETKMHSYTQIGFCYQQMKDYEKAIICFKKMLQIAWYISSQEWEMSSYDNSAVQYFYIGDLERSRYYNDRMLRGKSEAKFQVCRKIAAANTFKVMKKMKITQTKVLDISNPLTKSSCTLGKEFQELFSETLKDYSAVDKVLDESEVMQSPKVKHYSDVFIDPAQKFLQPGTPISDISGKDLPSPTGIKGEKNILPYYQEIDIDLVQKQEEDDNQKKDKGNLLFGDQNQMPHSGRNNKMNKTTGNLQSGRNSSSNMFSEEKDSRLRNEVIVKPICQMKQKFRGNPIAKYFQRLKQKKEEEAKIEQVMRAKRGKGYMTEEEKLRMSYDKLKFLKNKQNFIFNKDFQQNGLKCTSKNMEGHQ